MLTTSEALADPDRKDRYDGVFGFWDLVNQQDIAAVERVQNGPQARVYPDGRMCYHFEEPLHRFQNIGIDFMVGRRTIPPDDEDNTAAQQTAEPSRGMK